MITMLLPSKGRPDKAKQAIDRFNECRTTAKILLVLNDGEDYNLDVPTIHVPASSMCDAVNIAAKTVDTEFIGFIGDDHHVRTPGFDEIFEHELEDSRIVYGNDLLMGEKLATHCVMKTEVVKRLGYMAIPGLIHLFMDNFWMELGAKYVPEVIIEHMHYSVGKSSEDERYKAVNSTDVFGHDKRIFENWKQNQKTKDLEKLHGI